MRLLASWPLPRKHRQRPPRDAQRAGIELAKASRPTAYLGRKPSFAREQFAKVLTLADQGAMNTSQLAKAVGSQRMAVTRIRENPAKAQQQLAAWGL